MSRRPVSDDPWSRRHLLRALAAVIAVAVLGLFGAGYAVYAAVRGPAAAGETEERSRADSLPPGTARRDAVAAAPMLAVPPAASRGGTPTPDAGPAMVIPAPSEAGAMEVPTGFPRTPEGAVAQLAAIEAVVLQSMSVQTAAGVYHAWSTPGAPPVEEWPLVKSVQAFLSSRAGTATGAGGPLVVTTPAAAQIKGSDGPDWVLACVLMDVRAQVATTARIAYGHCERMQWVSDRWVIAAGANPSRAPSTWPGTDLARKAGWIPWSGPDQ